MRFLLSSLLATLTCLSYSHSPVSASSTASLTDSQQQHAAAANVLQQLKQHIQIQSNEKSSSLSNHYSQETNKMKLTKIDNNKIVKVKLSYIHNNKFLHEQLN